MGQEATETPGGTWIKVNTDKRGKEHIDVYSSDPQKSHDKSIHITLKQNGEGKITTKTDDNPRETTDTKCYLTTACIILKKHLMIIAMN